MANIYDMNAAIEKPNVLQSFRQGQQYGEQLRQQQQAQRDEQQLRQLAPQVVGGDPQAYAQAAAIDPQAAGQYDTANVNMAKRAAGAAAYMLDAVKRGNPQEIQGRYQAVLPFLTKLGAAQGKTPPPQFDPAMVPAMEQLVAMSQGMGADKADTVQSTRIGADGFYYTVDRSGNWTNSGIQADPRVQFRDVPGIDPGFVDLRKRTISPVQGAETAPPEGFDNGGGVTVDGNRVNLGLPPQQQEAVARAVSAMQAAGVDQAVIDNFIGSQMPQSSDRPMASPQGGVAAMRPAVSPAEQQRLSIAEQANRRAAEANARAAESARLAQRGSAPPGQRFRPDGSLEDIPGAKIKAEQPTEGERASAGYLGRMEAASRELEAVEAAGYDPGNLRDYATAGEGPMLNWMASQQGQQYRQQQEDWVRAKLRKESGAAIPESEMDREIKTYFPQPGDKPAVIESKKRSRTEAEKSLRQQAGRALQRRASDMPETDIDALLDKYR